MLSLFVNIFIKVIKVLKNQKARNKSSALFGS